MQGTAEIATALSKAQSEFPAIAKTRTAAAGSYSYQYADLADMIRALSPTLGKHGLSVSQLFGFHEGALCLRSILLHSSGERLESSLPIPWEGGRPQELGSFITYARRYSLAALLGVAAEEDDDGQAAETAGKPKPKRARSPQKAQTITRAQVERLFALCADSAERLEVPRKLVEGILRQALGDLGFKSTKDLTREVYEALCERMERLSLDDLAKHESQPAESVF